jgi:hypothetical protein
MPEETSEDMFQLAFLNMLFEVLGLFLNLFVAVFQGVGSAAVQAISDALGAVGT